MNFLHTFHPEALLIAFGPITIYWYGLFIVLGTILALSINIRLAKRFGIDKDTILDLAFWLILFGILGARIYHVAWEWDYYSEDLSRIYKVWQGGLAIHGAIIAGVITIWKYAERHKQDFWLLTAIAIPGLALAQAIGRWGNYFNQELFGPPTDLPWGIPISLAHRPLEFISNDYFHPAFIYESLGSLIIFLIFILILTKTKNSDFNFRITTISYLMSYALLRFTVEFWRVDTAPLLAGLKIAQLASILLFAISTALLIYLKKRRRKSPPAGPCQIHKHVVS